MVTIDDAILRCTTSSRIPTRQNRGDHDIINRNSDVTAANCVCSLSEAVFMQLIIMDGRIVVSTLLDPVQPGSRLMGSFPGSAQ